jgi:4-amino-4-deoxychorismate lyase
MELGEIKSKVQDVVDKSNQNNGLIRIFLTRGPGGFGVSPYECVAPQIYIVTTDLKEWGQEKVLKGASIRTSEITPKTGVFAQVKSLNYLPNVLMKKEAIDSGFDFSFGIGFAKEVLESSTENLCFVKGERLITPKFDSILRGTSLIRLTELMGKVSNLSWEQKDFNYDELISADEVFLVGTTIDVLPVTRIDSHIKPEMKRSLLLRATLQNDQK